VFNPDVLPFKRMTSLDAVRADYTLYDRSTTTTELTVGNKTDPSRDRFWGDVTIAIDPGVAVPLPSVAPDMRILSYEATPAVKLRFSKDAADNFSVRADDPQAHGTYRLVFLADADAGYFAPQLPDRDYSLDQVARRAEAEDLLPTLPTAVLAEADKSLRILQIERDDDLGRSFNRMVDYFRSFEARTLTDVTGDIYRDLFDTQAGVCRHRSFAFIITATAAGIPTRYITNEAHAFVEVWFPDRGWQRIDLGGAALELEVTDAAGKTLHRPRAEDPFSKPQAYEDNSTQLNGVHGLSDTQIADRQQPLGDGSSGDFDPLGDGTNGSGSGSGLGDDAVGPGDDVVDRKPPDPAKVSPRIRVTSADPIGYRGEAIRVEGSFEASDHLIDGVRVDVFVAPFGHAGNDAILIGRGTTDAAGGFEIDVDLPADLDLATYEVYVSTPDTAEHNSAISD
jgi:transglutaminase-like putative cysteine protease